VINAMERAFAHGMPMIVSPTPYSGVKFLNQVGSSYAERSFYRSSDSSQEDLDAFLGWFNEQFPIGISAHVLSEKVKAACHVRDDRLRGREFKPSFLQKPRDEWPDLSFQ
jgi:hypothetical protein